MLNNECRRLVFDLSKELLSILGYTLYVDDFSKISQDNFYSTLASIVELNKFGVKEELPNSDSINMCSALLYAYPTLFNNSTTFMYLRAGDYIGLKAFAYSQLNCSSDRDLVKYIGRAVKRFEKYLNFFEYSDLDNINISKSPIDLYNKLCSCIARQVLGINIVFSSKSIYDLKYFLRDSLKKSVSLSSLPYSTLQINTFDVKFLSSDTQMLGYRFTFNGSVRDVSIDMFNTYGIVLLGVDAGYKCYIHNNIYLTEDEIKGKYRIKSASIEEFTAVINAIRSYYTHIVVRKFN